MATLTGNSVASTYKQLLKVTSEGIGADASAKYIEDGLGTDSALSISTTRVGIGTTSPAVTLDVEKSVAGNYIATFTNTHATDGYGILIKAGDDANVRPLTVRDKDNTDLLTVKGDGDVTVSTGNLVIGTAGKGISFSATNTPAQSAGSGTSNLLDDYEEGTWTPAWVAATGTLGTINYTNLVGKYTKIGDTVHIKLSFYNGSFADGGASGALSISGLPFTASAGACSLSFGDTRLFAGDTPSEAQVNSSAAIIALFYRDAADGANTNLLVADAATGSGALNLVTISGTYFV